MDTGLIGKALQFELLKMTIRKDGFLNHFIYTALIFLLTIKLTVHIPNGKNLQIFDRQLSLQHLFIAIIFSFSFSFCIM